MEVNSVMSMQVTPSWGWILVYEYMFMFMAIFYGKYLHFCAVAGKQPGVTHAMANKVHTTSALSALLWALCLSILHGLRIDCLCHLL